VAIKILEKRKLLPLAFSVNADSLPTLLIKFNAAADVMILPTALLFDYPKLMDLRSIINRVFVALDAKIFSQNRIT
jgi:hypothetical protein